MTDADAPRVLELRVHGVNNTKPADLLDLPPYDVRQVAGDTRSSFWLAQPDLPPPRGRRGYVPPGIRREAYSWGGLVRNDAGSSSWMRAVVLAFQVLVLPLSIGNAAMWTRYLTTDADSDADRVRARLTAGAARLFGLVLTLIFASTAITVAVDMFALQCVGGTVCTGPWKGAWTWVTGYTAADALTAGRVLAVAALLPVLTVFLLVFFARVARRRYDRLHVMPGAIGDNARSAQDAAAETRAPFLRQPAFWSNQVTSSLGLVHFAAAVALTAGEVALHAAVRSAEPPQASGLWAVTIAAAIALAATIAVTVVLPTGRVSSAVVGAPRWTGIVSWTLLGVSLATALALVVLLWNATGPLPGPLVTAGFPPLVLVSLGSAIALSGLLWRRGHRPGTAWHGNAPAVFMTVSLALGMLTSAAVISIASIAAAGLDGPRLLSRALLGVSDGLIVPTVFLIAGGAIAFALIPFLLFVAATALCALGRSFSERITSWQPPAVDDELTKKVARRRRLASLVHVMEPVVAVLAALGAAAVVVSVVIAWSIPPLSPVDRLQAAPADPVLEWCIGFMVGAIAVVGLALAVIVAAFGVLWPTPGLVAIVWDITCFLPRTAQPFGPPCYAERAVPHVAQRLHDWLDGDPERRAVLAAHSMGGVIAVAALALLSATYASPAEERDAMRRVSLLTFGVQLRVLFGRLLPELVGPAVLGTYPARAPRPWRRDPWSQDADHDARSWASPPSPGTIDRLQGSLLPDAGVRWISLWRLTDYLGFPAVSGAPSVTRDGVEWRNGVDRYAEEVDRTDRPFVVVTHNDYIRVAAYDRALLDLTGLG